MLDNEHAGSVKSKTQFRNELLRIFHYKSNSKLPLTIIRKFFVLTRVCFIAAIVRDVATRRVRMVRMKTSGSR